MKIVIAPDSFKESLSASLVCRRIARGARKVFPAASIVQVPMADGGEGTMPAILGDRGRLVSVIVTSPLGNRITARYGLMQNGRTAVIEMAQASGIHLVPPAKRDPMRTTSYGTGELIRTALERGSRKIILTLGGVATNDAGAGMARALGFRFLDRQGRTIPDGVRGFRDLHRIESSPAHPMIRKSSFEAACDVRNPLCGPEGSARVYGPQKGATPAMVREIEALLRRFAKIVERDLGTRVIDLPGAGAAGGAGAGAVAFLNARLRSGVDIVIEETGLKQILRGADLMVTGEGKIDGQTLFGKTAAGVARIAKERGILVIALCGQTGSGFEKVRSAGIDRIFSVTNASVSAAQSLRRAGPLLEKAAEKAFRTIRSSLRTGKK